jgi:aminoglycoside phosphotransferase
MEDGRVTEQLDKRHEPRASLPATPSTESQPINNTRLRRFLVLAAVKLLKRIVPSHGAVIFVSSKFCIKFGPLRHLPEASAMQFIAQHTSIPVPKVYCAFTRKGWTYIAMEKINGEMVGRGWGIRSSGSKAKILAQLKGMVDEMRKICPPQGQGVSNVDGGPIWDCRLPGSSMCHGPFESVHDFHRFLRGGFDADPNHYPEVSELIALQDRAWPPSIFTHGDLSSLNILVRDDKIVGIVDWETAGWYPQYWEYTTASQVNPMNIFWREEIDKFLDPMPKELGMEKIRQKYFGDV